MDNNQKNHIGNALLFMCRYAYTRNTSADMACNSALKSLWEFVPDNQKQLILEEIQSELDLGTTANDPMLWEDFLKWREAKGYE